MTAPQQPGEQKGFLHGKLLIAMPGMTDPRFERSVILMCEHSDSGALGLIVNKPIDQLPFRELMQKMDIPVTPETPAKPVMFGGPVETSRGYVVHQNDHANRPATIAITSEIALTPTVDMLRAIAQGRGPEKWLMTLGYAGWSAGQIESEIVANGWLHCDADVDLVFDSDMGSKWQRAFGKLGAALSGLSSQVGRA